MVENAFKLDPSDAAKRVIASRVSFANCFDRLAEIHGARRFVTVASQRQRKVGLASGKERDFADYRAAFEEAKALGFFESLLELFGDRLLGAPAKPKSNAIIPVLAARDDESRQTIAAVYQKVMNNRGFARAEDVSNGLMRAMRNTCGILIDGTPMGTGFLIGPRLVLTCWHVVQSLLDPNCPKDESGTCIAESHKRLSVQFDFLAREGQDRKKMLACGVSEDWFVIGSRSSDPEHELDASDDGQRANWPTETNDLNTYLDFAVIELDTPVGFDRGYYDICSSSLKPADDAMLVLQHPRQYSMRVTGGTFNVLEGTRAKFAATAQSKCRVLHDANTEQGASGGLCLDYEMEPVAMHQAALEIRGQGNEQRKYQTNVAIPLTAIKAKAGSVIERRIGTFKAPRCHLTNGKVIIGRIPLQEAVTEAILGNYKILVVQIYYGQDDRPPSQIGKTFSTEIISDYLNLSLHQVVRMSAGRTKESAYKTATELLSAVSPDLVRDLPSEKDLKAESQSTQINDTIALLANKVCKILAGAATRRKLWVVIDELDLHPLTEGSTRLFFDRLYPEIAAQDSLRLVLIGLSDPDLPALQKVAPKKVDPLRDHLKDDDVAQWVALRLGGIVVPDDQLLSSLGKIAVKVAEQYGVPVRSAAVSRVINDIFDPLLPKRT